MGPGVAERLVPSPYALAEIWRETADVWSLALEPRGRDGLPAAAPGQFNMLYAFGVGEAPISISGMPEGGGPLVHTVRAVGNVTRALCEARPGDVLGVRGPYGSSWPVEAARGRDVVVVAGGIGLAPLRPVLTHVIAHRDEYRRVALVYGARTPADVLYRSALERWRSRFDLHVDVTVDSAGRGWGGNVGHVTDLLPSVPFDVADAVAFVCGPEIMMRFAVRDLLDRGASPADVHVSLERNMKCAVGLCGHCQLGAEFVCRSGPVYPYERVSPLLGVREL